MAGLIDELTASVDPALLMRRVAEQTCVLIPQADGAAVSLRDHNDCLVVLSVHGVMESVLGRVTPVDRTFTGLAMSTGRPELCDDLTADERLTDEVRTVGIGLGLRSCLTVPLFRGTVALGAISVVSRAAHAFGEPDIESIASLSSFISAMISANTEMARLLQTLLGPVAQQPESGPAARFVASLIIPEVVERDRLQADIDMLARPGALTAVFQPIVDLNDLTIHSLEGLSRFPDHHLRGPDHWFGVAHRVGRGPALELLALGAILDAAAGVPDRYAVGVNLSPIVALHPAVQDTLLATRRPLVVELTEHEPAPEPLAAGLETLRRHGIALAVDDTGSGFASLTQILRLRPEIIKLDRELTVDIDTDPVRRTLAAALVLFAGELGAATVAEGIERVEQFRVLRDLGIRYGQGFWFGHPAPVEDLLPALTAGRVQLPRS